MAKPTYIYVTPFFPSPTNWRGSYCYDFVRALMATDLYDVKVFREGGMCDYDVNGIVVHCFSARRLPSNLFPNLFSRVNCKRFLDAVANAGVSHKDVAVCHANTANYGVYALALKKVNSDCLSVLHHHDLASFGLNMGICHTWWLYNLLQYPIFRRMHEQIDCHVFISEASRKSFLDVPNTDWTVYGDYRKQYRGLNLYRGPKIKHSVVLHNGVDRALFRKAKSCDHNCFTIGCVGNFEVLKDQATLIRAVGNVRRQFPDKTVKVLLLGSGPVLSGCRRLASELGVEAEFLPEVRHEQLPDFYHRLDLFVLPSFFEGFGCVYAEAASCGVPFIGVRGQGIQDLVGDWWLIDPHDDVALAEKIVAVMERRAPSQVLLREIGMYEVVGEYAKTILTLQKGRS